MNHLASFLLSYVYDSHSVDPKRKFYQIRGVWARVDVLIASSTLHEVGRSGIKLYPRIFLCPTPRNVFFVAVDGNMILTLSQILLIAGLIVPVLW